MQQQSAMASLQSKITEMSKDGVPDLTMTAIKEVVDKPKMAAWMRQCGAALHDYVSAVDRPLGRPIGRQGCGYDHGDRLTYKVWTMWWSLSGCTLSNSLTQPRYRGRKPCR